MGKNGPFLEKNKIESEMIWEKKAFFSHIKEK
jgi:hypothetical protein